MLLDEPETLDLLAEAAEQLARAEVPGPIARAYMTARLTALQKPRGGVRGIATGATFRRLVARTLAKQFAEEVESACAPYQFAMSTRAGTDCVGHAVRAITDGSETATVLSIDGVGAYDHIHREAMLGKLQTLPQASRMLPFVRLAYAQPSQYEWVDESGAVRMIHQGEGGEQGHPLMPLLFSLGIHDALARVDAQLREGEHLFAFLDDVYTIAEPDRIRFIYDRLQEELSAHAGIQLHTGKTRVWNRKGECPPGIEQLGPEVWSPQGLKVLGTPIGSEEFTEAHVQERLEDEKKFWEAIPEVPDLQSAWQLLLQ